MSRLKKMEPELRTALRLDDGNSESRPSQTDLIDGLYKQREELQKRLIDLEEQYLARDVRIITDLGLKWPPDTTFAEVLTTAWEINKKRDSRLLYLPNELWVLAIDDWLQSTEVQAEIELFHKENKPVRLVQQTPDGWEVGTQIWQVG